MNASRASFLAGLGSAAVLAPTVVRAADPFRLIITETEVPLVPNSVSWLAISGGYFKRAGVDVELVKVQQTPSAVAALRSGEGDMANLATDTVLQLLGRQQMQLRGICSPDKALPFQIVGKKGIAKPKDLEGKTFGVARVGSVDYEMTRVVLAKLGVDPDALRYLSIGQPAIRAQALLAGQIDATTVSVGVYVTLPQKGDLNVVVDNALYYRSAPFVTKINVVTADVDKAKSAQIAAVVRGYITAARAFAAQPQLWVDAMAAARSDVPRAQLVGLADLYRKSWSVNGGLDLTALRFTTDALFKGPDFADVKRVEPSDWVDQTYVATVLKALGTDRIADDPAA